MNIQFNYLLLYLGSVFVSSVSQVLLKKAALQKHESVFQEYTDWRVILGYTLFLGCTVLTMLAYRGIPLSLGPVLETTSYIFVSVFGVVIFKEKINPIQKLAMGMIIIGILLYSL